MTDKSRIRLLKRYVKLLESYYASSFRTIPKYHNAKSIRAFRLARTKLREFKKKYAQEIS